MIQSSREMPIYSIPSSFREPPSASVSSITTQAVATRLNIQEQTSQSVRSSNIEQQHQQVKSRELPVPAQVETKMPAQQKHSKVKTTEQPLKQASPIQTKPPVNHEEAKKETRQTKHQKQVQAPHQKEIKKEMKQQDIPTPIQVRPKKEEIAEMRPEPAKVQQQNVNSKPPAKKESPPLAKTVAIKPSSKLQLHLNTELDQAKPVQTKSQPLQKEVTAQQVKPQQQQSVASKIPAKTSKSQSKPSPEQKTQTKQTSAPIVQPVVVVDQDAYKNVEDKPARIKKLAAAVLKPATQRQVSRHRRFNGNPQEKSQTSIMGGAFSPINNEYSNDFVAKNEPTNLLALPINTQSQSFVSQDKEPADSDAMLSKEFLKTRKLMMMKNIQKNSSRQMNLLGSTNLLGHSQVASNRSSTKSPLHGFRERRYKLGGQKVVFKRNVSVTQVPQQQSDSRMSQLGNVYQQNNNNYFDVGQINSFQHTSAVQAIIANLNKQNDDHNSSQGSFRLNVTYDIITPEAMADSQKIKFPANPSPQKSTSAKKNQKLLKQLQTNAPLSRPESTDKNPEIIKLQQMLDEQKKEKKSGVKKETKHLQIEDPMAQPVSQDTINDVSPRNPLLSSNEMDGQSNSLMNTGTFKPILKKKDSFTLATQSNFADTPNNQTSDRKRSDSRTSDIFKRSIDHSSSLPIDGVVREIQFDQLITNQRDALFLDKVEKQSKIREHRRNSETRKSIELDKKSQQEETRRLKREQRKMTRGLSTTVELKQQQKKPEVDLWAGPVKYQTGFKSQIPSSSPYIRKVDRKEDDWDYESQFSSKLQTLDESEKIKNMNAWIAKQPPTHQRQNALGIDFLSTQHFKAVSNFDTDNLNLSNFNKNHYQSNQEKSRPSNNTQINFYRHGSSDVKGFASTQQKRATSNMFYKPHEEEEKESELMKQESSFEDEW